MKVVLPIAIIILLYLKLILANQLNKFLRVLEQMIVAMKELEIV